jgi:drug/metabolite transporter (DMT)-like permease
MPASRYRNDTALLFVVLVWGVNFPVLKAALAVMHPHVINIFRFFISAAVLGGIYAARADTWEAGFFAPLRTHARQIVMLGLLGYVIYQVSFIVGVNHTTAGSAALIMAASPLWTAMISRVAGYERLGYWAWAGLVISLVGTGLVVIAGAEAAALSGSLTGNLLMLLASVLWGAYTAFNKTVVHDVSPTGATFFGIAIALPFLVGIGVPYLDTVAWPAVDLWVWGAIIFSGGLSTGLAFAIWNTAVKNVGASNTAVYSNLVPFIALLGGALFLDEPVAWIQVVGGVLIIGGLFVMRQRRRRPIDTLDEVAAKGVSALESDG